MSRFFPRAGALAALLLLAGCFFGKVPETKYFVMDYGPTPPPERLQKGPYPFVLRMRDCELRQRIHTEFVARAQHADQNGRVLAI